MKACPFCAEMIQDTAIKCRFCGSRLDGGPQRSASAGPRVAGPACPKCGGHELRPGPWPWYLGTVGAMIVRAVQCTGCGHHFDAKKPEADLSARKKHLAVLINGIGGLGIVLIIGSLVAFIMATMR